MIDNEVEFFVKNGKKWYTVSSFSKHMGVSRTTVYAWLKRKDLLLKKNITVKTIGLTRFLTNE